MRHDLVAWLVLDGRSPWRVPARAEVFNLHDGGQIRGELVNRDESPRKTYVIKTASGGQVTLDAEQVKDVAARARPRCSTTASARTIPTRSTASGSWPSGAAKTVCPRSARSHLERIIELDPDHADARHALGYAHVHGRWATAQDVDGRERLRPLQGAVGCCRRKSKSSKPSARSNSPRPNGRRKLKRWHGWLGSDQDRGGAGVHQGHRRPARPPSR